MFRIYIPSQRKVDTFRQVKFKPSSPYTSVDTHYPPLPEEADLLSTPPVPLRPSTPPPTTVPQISPPPLTTSGYEVYSDEDSESERVPDAPIAGPSTPPRSTSRATPSAHKSSRRKDFTEVPETPKLDYKTYPKRSKQGVDRYSESGWAHLVVEPNSYKEAMA